MNHPDTQDAVLGGQTPAPGNAAVLGGIEGLNQAYQKHHNFRERSPNGIELDMIAIPAGTFLMGSPEDEAERDLCEGPQHQVTVPRFFLGKYPVTQAQWQVVTALPKVNIHVKLNPSSFQGDDRPVEHVCWVEAVEFCDRLSQHTGRPYRLPSEAEWEYACRAGTTTPYHFGQTITPELANYNGHRGETTPVGSFGITNAFGLSDMHGNVAQWCLDYWHENYEDAPTDGSAWVDEDTNKKYAPDRVLRGSSWTQYPRTCRSAHRQRLTPFLRFDYAIGFRVACSAWTQ